MKLIPTGNSTSFFPIAVLRRGFYLCLDMGMERLAAPSTSMHKVRIIQCPSLAI